MMSVTRALLIVSLFAAKGVHSTEYVPSEEREVSSLGDYERLMDLRSLGKEFVREFQNISSQDLHLLEGRTTEQDLVCLADLAQFMKDLTAPKLWALQMIDSWGSIPSGYLKGSNTDMGNYDECVELDRAITDSHSIRGKFCFLSLPVAKWLGFNSELLKSTYIKTAVCFPSSCSASNFEGFLKRVLQRVLGLSDPSALFSISEETCRTNESEPLDGLTIFTLVLIGVFLATAVLCTLYDYFLCSNQEKLPKLVRIFSARAISRDLFTLAENKDTPNVIHCLNGMRCMSLIWVVFGHDFTSNLAAASTNEAYKITWMSQAFSSFILYAPFSVDTFFFISGLLLVAIGLRSLDKTKGSLNVPLMYLHRYLRLTPIVIVALLVYTKLLSLVADGPMYNISVFSDYSVCKSNWYWDLLYVQNYATDDICLPHTWYLAVDMQLYILSPILLVALYKWGKRGAAGIVLLILLSSASLFVTIMINDYHVMFKDGLMMPGVQKKIYNATHNHAAPWLIGALFGYFLHSIRGREIRLHVVLVWMGWLLSLAVMFTSMFALYPYARFLGPSPTILEGALYYTLTRIGWPLALCWVVFACLKGYGSLANSFLSSPLWQPISKLSYSAYIWHVFILEVNHRRVRSVSYFSNYDAMLSFWSCFGFTLLMSYVFYVILEAPLEALERLAFPSRRKVERKVEIDEETDVQSLEQSAPQPELKQDNQDIVTTKDTVTKQEA
ncbi:nose resistant to fluoxetine protein 6 [Drosophila ficusphila]|uniref:nose resistant to fluoxetine protein 6 n=1 Tax=Drosophila ficusphila TaxID=30025 RepID=UPI0007E70B9A|nr:nose resistant to fluoxetine protein 6 [Drosophila ficusphila]